MFPPSEASGSHGAGQGSQGQPAASDASGPSRRKVGVSFSLAPHSVTTTVVTTTTTKITEFPPLLINPPPLPKHLDTSLFPLANTPTTAGAQEEYDVYEDNTVMNEPQQEFSGMETQLGTDHMRQHYDGLSIVSKEAANAISIVSGRGLTRKRPRMSETDSPSSYRPDDMQSDMSVSAAPVGSADGGFPRTPAPMHSGRHPMPSIPLTPFPEATQVVHLVTTTSVNATPSTHNLTPLNWTNPPPTLTTTTSDDDDDALLPATFQAPPCHLPPHRLHQTLAFPAFRDRQWVLLSFRLTPDPTGSLEESRRGPEIRIPTLSDLPGMISSFDGLPQPLQSYVLLQLLRRCPANTLQFISSLILPTLKRDFVGLLPIELSFQILEWHRVVDGEGAETAVWKKRLVREGWYREDEVKEESYKKMSALASSNSLAFGHASSSKRAFASSSSSSSSPADVSPTMIPGSVVGGWG
ncbi:hypothetical protein BC829DRAFT_449450 [Chytridium lagenaria]|nr:hypothetical protein BC829DRAFT_449450 [Chytridium lagenaria]